MMRSLRFLFLTLALGAAPAYADEPAAPAQSEPSAQSRVDELFARLGKTEDADEAAGIVSALQSEWMASGSDASDLLMSRAIEAFSSQDYPLALQLLDALVASQPDWAEAWNKRATVRFFAGDAQGSAADVAQTLKRNPRHIGALAGLAAIFEQAGKKEDALKVYERAAEIAPHYAPLVEAVTRLKAELAGQSL
jgi:tetratricopeptide (TPR) repeat protein